MNDGVGRASPPAFRQSRKAGHFRLPAEAGGDARPTRISIFSWRFAFAAVLLLAAARPAAGLDPFDTASEVPKTPAGALLDVCVFHGLGRPLALAEAVERSLCGHPRTKAAWAAVKAEAAAVGAAQGAFLPSLSGQVQGLRDNSKTKVANRPDLTSADIASTDTAAVSLNWVLYDFGGRTAALDNATALLAAAKAGHEAALQLVFAAVAKDYYAAAAAEGLLAAAVEAERTAKDSFALATRLVGIGTSAASDALQAQTAYVQAQLDHARAEGARQSALGTLAADMMLRPDEAIALPDGDGAGGGVEPDGDFQETVSALIDDAVRRHPDVRSAEAQARAAEAATRQTEAEGLPNVSLVGRSSRDNQPVDQSLGLPYLGATHTDNSIGLQVSVPLFEGFTRDYKIRQAEAEAEAKRYAALEAQRQVGLDVWTAYQSVRVATQNLGHAARLLEIADKSYTVAQHQYAISIGSMIELLNAQSALAAARRQKIQSLSDWRTSRIDLAQKLGRLDMREVER